MSPLPRFWKTRVRSGDGTFSNPESTFLMMCACIHWKTSSTFLPSWRSAHNGRRSSWENAWMSRRGKSLFSISAISSSATAWMRAKSRTAVLTNASTSSCFFFETFEKAINVEQAWNHSACMMCTEVAANQYLAYDWDARNMSTNPRTKVKPLYTELLGIASPVMESVRILLSSKNLTTAAITAAGNASITARGKTLPRILSTLIQL
mmetsp:Transcript_25352/g.51211  ORF Transcript_25352/g.51211 Transcript_25352/m.51211 type:complete len:207 (-) Transcript_25352:35-655(-)